jgi:hypothetical protein
VIPPVGITPRLSDAELVTLAAMQAILGYTSEAKWLRHARAHLGVERRRMGRGLHPGGMRPLPRDRQTLRPGRGLRLHLVCTRQGLPIAFALTGAKADERETLLGLLAAECELLRERPRQTLIGDKNYFGRGFECELSEHGVQLLRPARKGEREWPGAALFKPLRQVIESINETFKGQLDLERHRGRTPGGVIARVMQRVLALTAAIWHNDATGQTVLRSLIDFGH